MTEFGLSERGNDLHREINSHLPKLDDLLDALTEAGSERLRYLKSQIT
jgi:hypothetical protein